MTELTLTRPRSIRKLGLLIVATFILLSTVACLSAPSEVQDEFVDDDGQRPNNFRSPTASR